MFVCIVMYICLVFYYIFSGLLGSGWFGCLFVLLYCKSLVCFKCFLVLLYNLPLPSLLGLAVFLYLVHLACILLQYCASPSCRLCMHILCTHHCAITAPMMYWHLATGGL